MSSSVNVKSLWMSLIIKIVCQRQRRLLPGCQVMFFQTVVAAIQLFFSNKQTEIPSEPGHKDQVQPFIDDLKTENMQESLRKFTNFRTRYYKSRWGAKSCRWLLSKIQEIAAPVADRVSVHKFEHSVCNTILSDNRLLLL